VGSKPWLLCAKHASTFFRSSSPSVLNSSPKSAALHVRLPEALLQGLKA